MNARTRHLMAIGAVAAVLGAGIAARASADDAAPGEPGSWQKHEFTFRYMGFTSTYSCDGLADQLRRLLTIAGARADLKAEPGACASGFGRPDKFASARLSFYTLAPSATSGSDGGASGAWHPVELHAMRPPGLQTGDCELVEQFRDEVLKKMFAIRGLADHTRCVPHQESGSLIDLNFETFAAAAGAAALPGAAPSVFVYPKSGQSKEQQAKDRAECEASARSQSGYDPAKPAAGGQGGAYGAALTACLEPRGYTVR